MSKIEVDTIDTQSSTTLQVGSTNTSLIKIGTSGDTVEYPAGTTFTQSGTQNITSGGAINVQSGGNITIDSGATITNNGTASGFSADLTNLNATNLTSGTVPDARFPATLPIANGSALTNLNATNLGSGTVPDARFPATLPAISGANLTNLPGGGFQSIQSFTSSGTWTKPTGITKIKVYVTGGGGGGGGGTANYNQGGGGHGGGTAIKVIDVSAVSSVSVTIGNKGNGASATNDGTSGSTSSFGSYCSATGGGGGKQPDSAAGSIAYPGVGADGSPSGNFVELAGAFGQVQGQHSAFNQTGGGAGGCSFWGGGGLAASDNLQITAKDGITYGSGGGGGNHNGSYSSGADGIKGFVLVEEYK